MSSVDPTKITPEQKKFLESLPEASSVFSEQEINEAVEGLQNELISANQSLIENLSPENYEQLNINQVQPQSSSGVQRSPSNNSGPIIQGPTRAQDQFTLRQAPTALMAGVPRQKFEYLATFRFYGNDTFETIFGDDQRIQTLDQQINSINQPAPSAYSYSQSIPQNKQKNDLIQKRAGVMDTLRRSLVFNIKQIDGPKINFQYDTLNQYNRKRNVYRRVDYDPVSVRFHDTMDNTAVKFFRYLYELNLKDGRNRHKDYGGVSRHNKGLYQTNPLSSEDDFTLQHNFGLESSISNNTYPIKSLDLFLIHGRKYNLIRFVHPKIISMDHDALTYEASTPIELGMQFAYETVVYETLNYDMASPRDVTIDFDQLLGNSLQMPETPNTISADVEGSDGTAEPDIDWTKLTTNLPDETSSITAGSGSNLINTEAFAHNIQQAGAAFGGSLQNISSTPFSDAINGISNEVYSATKSAVSSFNLGGVSGGGTGTDFAGGVGDAFSGAFAGASTYNTGSSASTKQVGGYVKDRNGKLVLNRNGTPVRNPNGSSKGSNPLGYGS